MKKTLATLVVCSALALVGGCTPKEPEVDNSPPMQNNPNSKMTEMPQDAATNTETLDQGLSKENGTGLGN